jgi:cell division protein ZapA
MSNERIAVMAALNLSHEVLALRDKVSTDGDQLARRIKSLRDKVELALNDSNQLEL